MRNSVAFWWIFSGVCSQANCLKIFFLSLFKAQYISFGLLPFHGEESTRDSPPEAKALTFHPTEYFVSFWSKISVDLGACQLHNSCAIQENHAGLRRLNGFIKLGRGRGTGCVISLSDLPQVSLSNAEDAIDARETQMSHLQDAVVKSHSYLEQEAVGIRQAVLVCSSLLASLPKSKIRWDIPKKLSMRVRQTTANC